MGTSAAEWDMRVDLRRQLVSRGDYHLNSQTRHSLVVQINKEVVLLELTVPWNERMEEAHERKLGKYQPFIHKGQEVGWRA